MPLARWGRPLPDPQDDHGLRIRNAPAAGFCDFTRPMYSQVTSTKKDAWALKPLACSVCGYEMCRWRVFSAATGAPSLQTMSIDGTVVDRTLAGAATVLCGGLVGLA